MSIDSFEVEEVTSGNNFVLSPEAKNEIYRRYLKNLNYTQNSSNENIRNYAKMFFIPENITSGVDLDVMSTTDLVSDDLPFTMNHAQIITVLLIVIYAIIFVLGMLGNIVTCIVIAKNRSMHTMTNYYLFRY
jgi:hypothetical protein